MLSCEKLVIWILQKLLLENDMGIPLCIVIGDSEREAVTCSQEIIMNNQDNSVIHYFVDKLVIRRFLTTRVKSLLAAKDALDISCWVNWMSAILTD